VGVCAVLLAGCAEHASSSPIEVDIVAERYAGLDDPNGLHFTNDEARCTAERVVQSVGPARLRELGLAVDPDTPPELSEPPLTEEEADAVFAAIEACIDLERQLVEVLAGGSASEGEATCVASRYLATDLPRRAILSGSYSPELNAEIDAVLDEAAGHCRVASTPD
jgi:hypothetical protein